MLKYLPIVLCCTAQRKYSLCSKVFPVVLKIIPIMLHNYYCNESCDDIDIVASVIMSQSQRLY